MGNGEDRRESRERQEGRASFGESSGAARVPESKQGLVGLCRHHLSTGRIPHLNGTSCIKGRHTRPQVPVCSIAPHQRASRASLPRGREPGHLSLPRLGGLTGGIHVCASRAKVGRRAVGSRREGSGLSICQQRGKELVGV